MVAHDTHGADTGQNTEELRHLALIAILCHFIPEHPVGLLENFHLLGGDFADDAHAQTGAGEGLPPHQFLGDAQFLAHPAHLVLEQILQWLDGAQELHVLGLLDHIVVGLNLIGLALAGLNAVGIDGTLGEEAVLAALAADFAPESLRELGADNLPLLLGVSHALEAGKEMLLAVQPDKVHIKELGEGLLHEVALVLPHQTLVHKHAGQLVAHGTGDKPRCHRGIHAAGQTQNHLLVANLLPQRLHGILNKGIHPPQTLAAAHFIQEVFQHLLAELAMGHFGVELNGIQLLFCIFHGSHRAHIGVRRDPEALGQPVNAVGMAHPHHALGRNVLHQQGIGGIQLQVNLAVFAGFGGDDAAAAHPGGELCAIADAQHRDAQREHLGVIVGGSHIIDAVGATGEDDAAIALCHNLLRGDAVIGLDFSVHIQVANPAGNQLVILTAKVQNEDFFHRLSFLFSVVI